LKRLVGLRVLCDYGLSEMELEMKRPGIHFGPCYSQDDLIGHMVIYGWPSLPSFSYMLIL
jgi:hypothetical protein